MDGISELAEKISQSMCTMQKHKQEMFSPTPTKKSSLQKVYNKNEKERGIERS